MASWPSSLPSWKLPLSHKADEGVLRTNMSVGPAKLRKRYSAVPTQFQTTFWCNGIQQQILQGFYNQNQASEFERIDPVTGDTQYFRFLTSPEFRTRVGAKLPSERLYEVTLSLERMPGSPDKAFTVLLDGDYANPLIGFTRNSPAWYFGSDGLLKEAAANEMRFEYDPATGELLGLLIEEGRTNSLLDSRDMTTGSWTTTETTVARDAIGIDGNANKACTVTGTEGASDRVEQAFTVSDNSNTHVFSAFIKKEPIDAVAQFRADLTGGTSVVESTLFNAATGESSDSSFTVEDYGNWWRIWGNITNNGTGNTSFILRLYSPQELGSRVYDQAQVELNVAKPSSPIITGSTTVTRSAEDSSVTDISWYNEAEGTFIIECKYRREGTGSGLILSNGTNHRILYDSGYNGSVGTYDGTTINTTPANTVANNTFSQIAVGIANNQSIVAVDGILYDEASFDPAPLTKLDVGADFNGHIKRLHYYPERLPNAKLQELTR